MKPRIITLVFVTLAFSHACVLAQQSMPQPETPKEAKMVHAPAPSSPEWQQLKTLVGYGRAPSQRMASRWAALSRFA